jgi:hypothetical protein
MALEILGYLGLVLSGSALVLLFLGKAKAKSEENQQKIIAQYKE